MTKQRTEEMFRNCFKHFQQFNLIKLQVNKEAHCTTHGDYLLQTKKYDCIIECKETKWDNRFSFSRVTQEFKLMEWENKFKRNKSFLFVTFFKRGISGSDVYIIPIKDYISLRKKSKLKSLNRVQFMELFVDYLIISDEKLYEVAQYFDLL
jgi:hypothetical protein